VAGISPFLKWAGGKRALLYAINPLIPEISGRYIEPFLGAGAVFLSRNAQTPKWGNDNNQDLIEVYNVIANRPFELIDTLRSFRNDKEFFLEVREWDRQANFYQRDPVDRAARFIYLNKTCFNGLYRVNASGQFNVPFGNFKNPDFVCAENISAVSLFLKASNNETGERIVTLTSGDYLTPILDATFGDFVYCDPPYDPLTSTSSFVGYQKGGFSRADQVALRDALVGLSIKGVDFLTSNHDTEFIRDIYSDGKYFKLREISVQRAISARAASRGPVGELLITGVK